MHRSADEAGPGTLPRTVERTVQPRSMPMWPGLLLMIVVMGGIARFWNLYWDSGAYYFHPDEWALNQIVRRLGPDLHPHFFFYGSLPIYLYRLSAEVLTWLTGDDWLAPERVVLVGRTYSVLASTAVLPLVFMVGRRLWGVGAGLLAAGFAAAAGLSIQAAHFGTVDSMVTLAGLGLLWCSLELANRGSWRLYIVAGVMLGLAVATKLTAASFLVLPLIGHLYGLQSNRPSARKSGWRGPLLLAGTALVTTLLTSPYYLLAWDEFWRAVVEQSDELSGGYRLPYTWQFIGSTPYLFELRSLIVWGLGVPLGVTSIAGWCWALVQALLLRSSSLVLLTVWPTLYFLYVGTWEARFVRHLLPLVPWCCLFAVGGLLALSSMVKHRSIRPAPVGNLLVGLVVGLVAVGAAVWGLAVLGIYQRPDTRLAATEWIASNFERGSVIIVEDKNDLVPVLGSARAGGTSPGAYEFGVLRVTADDTSQKMAEFASVLARGDLLVVPNRRWSGVLPRMERFTLTGRYYRLLFDGELGYSPAVTFASPPRLGPFVWRDDSAEETFQVFDHPTVRLFRNTGRLPENELKRLLGAEGGSGSR